MTHEPNDAPARPDRRQAIRQGLGMVAAAAVSQAVPISVAGALAPAAAPHGRARRVVGDRRYLDAARGAAAWLERCAIKTEHGTTWAIDPRDPSTVQNDLYSGSPGVVLFFLEMHHATGDPSYLQLASSGADHLAAELARDGAVELNGLYAGVAGIGYVLEEAYRSTKNEAHRSGARRAVAMLQARARDVDGGVEWNDSTDIIDGSAGIGCFLIYASRAHGDPSALDLAGRAGIRLVALAQHESRGWLWRMDPTFPRLMPNFAHGTAGVSYYLATLGQLARERAFTDAAQQGAEYLLDIATPVHHDGLMVFHHDPGGRDLYYLSWCHGPAGTARLYWRLSERRDRAQHMATVRRLAQGIMGSGIPERRTPGFWNNISQCCGNCGVVEFFLSLYTATNEQAYLAFATRAADDLLKRATTDDSGTRWVQAENRISPTVTFAQTGLMQGAAGAGIALLHLDGQAAGRAPRIVLPDSPFG